MPDKSDHKLKLGKGASFFVKTQIHRLRPEEDTWEADFFPISVFGIGTRQRVVGNRPQPIP